MLLLNSFNFVFYLRFDSWFLSNLCTQICLNFSSPLLIAEGLFHFLSFITCVSRCALYSYLLLLLLVFTIVWVIIIVYFVCVCILFPFNYVSNQFQTSKKGHLVYFLCIFDRNIDMSRRNHSIFFIQYLEFFRVRSEVF